MCRGKKGNIRADFCGKTWGLDLGAPAKPASTARFSGAARQHAFAIAVDDRLYCWGVL
jgi:hypothetical protein